MMESRYSARKGRDNLAVDFTIKKRRGITAPGPRLDGKVMPMAGGGAGIGRAIAEAYADLRPKVAVAANDSARAGYARRPSGRPSD